MFNFSFSVQDYEYFLLILVRVTSFAHTAPFFSTANVPRRVKIGLSIFLAFLLYRYVVPPRPLGYDTVLGYAVLVLQEAMCGAIMGFGANICLYIVQFAGQLTDMDVGLSMVNLFDPVSRQQIGFTGTLYQYGLLLIMVSTNLHHFVFRTFVDAFRMMPIGMAHINPDNLLEAMITFIGDDFMIGFRIYLPIYTAILLLNSVLGILAKIAPQMNMFVVGMQLKILVGLTVLFLTAYLLPDIADLIFGEMQKMMRLVIDAMAG